VRRTMREPRSRTGFAGALVALALLGACGGGGGGMGLALACNSSIDTWGGVTNSSSFTSGTGGAFSMSVIRAPFVLADGLRCFMASSLASLDTCRPSATAVAIAAA